MHRLLECGVLLRIYTYWMSGLYTYTSLNWPETITYRVAHADTFAHYTMIALGIFVFFAIVDMVVNDLLPERFVLHRALHDRHLVSMAIAGCYAVQMFTCVRYDLPEVILAYYAGYVVLVPVSAFVDVQKRYKKKACK